MTTLFSAIGATAGGVPACAISARTSSGEGCRVSVLTTGRKRFWIQSGGLGWFGSDISVGRIFDFLKLAHDNSLSCCRVGGNDIELETWNLKLQTHGFSA